MLVILVQTCVLPVFSVDFFFFFQAEDGIRAKLVTGVQTCALPILAIVVSLLIALMKTVDLVLHARDEQRDDDGQALQMRGGRLVAERFAAARGEHDDGIAPVEDGGDGFALQRKEAVVAPDTPYGLVNELRLDDANIIADRGLPVPAFVANRMSGRVSIFRSAASAVATASPAAAGGGGSARGAVRWIQRSAGGRRAPPDFSLTPDGGR